MTDTIRHSQTSQPTVLLRPALWRRIGWPYGVTTLFIAASFGVKLVFASALRGEASYVLFVPAILIGSRLVCWECLVLVSSLGLSLRLAFVSAAHQFEAADVTNGVSFPLLGFAVAWRVYIVLRFRYVYRMCM